MRILIGCECSGIVRDAFAARGHDAWSCDFKPYERKGNHIQGDLIEAISSRRWDMLIAHPECTFVCGSGIHWNNRGRGWDRTEQAVAFFKTLLDCDIERIALENPTGILSTRIRPPDQYIQPYQYGDDASKNTGLWLKNLPMIVGTKYVHPRIVVKDGKEYKRWANQTDSGQNKLGPSPTRSTDRARTYQGIADAMASQWG